MSVYPLILFQFSKKQGLIYHCINLVYLVLGILLLLFSIVVVIKNML